MNVPNPRKPEKETITPEHTEVLSISDADTEKMPVKILWFIEKMKNFYLHENSKNQNILDIQKRIGPFINKLKRDDQIDVTVTFVGPVKHGFLSTLTESIPGINPHVDLQIYRDGDIDYNKRYTEYSDYQHSEFLLNTILLLSKDHLFTNAGITRESIGVSSNSADDRTNLTNKIKKLFTPFLLTKRRHLEKKHIDYLINGRTYSRTSSTIQVKSECTNSSYKPYRARSINTYQKCRYYNYNNNKSVRTYSSYYYYYRPSGYYNRNVNYIHQSHQKFILYNFPVYYSQYNSQYNREEVNNSKYISHLKDYFDPQTHLNVIVNHIHNHTFDSYEPSKSYISSDERISNETFVNFLKSNYNGRNLSSFRNYAYTSNSPLNNIQMNNNPFYDLTAKLSGNENAQYLHTGTSESDFDSFFTDLTNSIKRDTTFKVFTLESECKQIEHVKFNSIKLNHSLFSCNGRKFKVNAKAIEVGPQNIIIKYYRKTS